MTNQGEHLTAMTDAWTRMTESVFRGALAANTAAFSAFDRTETETNETETETPRTPGVDSVAYENGDWHTERSVDDREEITVGDYVEFAKRLDDDDVRAFAEVSGDTNRLHLDDEFAGVTRFEDRIVHGTLVSGLISAALARIPGLTIYISQDLEFRAPVGIGNRVTARVEVVEELGGGRYRLSTVVTDEDSERVVIDGEAVVLVDDVPDEAADD
jgi:acyl dehydratase